MYLRSLPSTTPRGHVDTALTGPLKPRRIFLSPGTTGFQPAYHTGLWLDYNGLRYGPDQGIAKSPGKPWKMARLEIYGRKTIWLIFFLHLDILLQYLPV